MTSNMDDFDLSGLQSPPAQPAGWPEAAKTAAAAGAGCTLIVLVEFVLICFLIQGIFSATVPEGFAACVNAPPRANQGQPAAMTLQVRNDGERPFTVRSITARSTTRRRFKLDQFRPAPKAPMTSLFGVDTWIYSQTVEPGKKWAVQLQATPQQAGKLRGTLEIQVDRGVRQVPFVIEVAPPSTSPIGARPTGSEVKH